ncbi:MAG: outer membrane lipoprotein carrier protein LolA [Bdellovibrionaceae bacterium]|nr:outer membrane lipoprotein carrier protein LolA [Pseudobdellovibrionaceae bacterium]
MILTKIFFIRLSILGLVSLAPNFSSSTAFAAAQLADFHHLEGRFQQSKLLRELDLEIKTTGNFQVLRPKGRPSVFYWNIVSPKPSKICIDDVGIVINKKNLKFSEVGAETGDQISGMLKIITMDSAKIEESFLVEKKNNQLFLTPKNLESSFFNSATLTLNNKNLVDDVLLIEKSKDQIHIHFSDLKVNIKKIAQVEQCPR